MQNLSTWFAKNRSKDPQKFTGCYTVWHNVYGQREVEIQKDGEALIIKQEALPQIGQESTITLLPIVMRRDGALINEIKQVGQFGSKRLVAQELHKLRDGTVLRRIHHHPIKDILGGYWFGDYEEAVYVPTACKH